MYADYTCVSRIDTNPLCRISVATFFRKVALNQPRPSFTWSIDPANGAYNCASFPRYCCLAILPADPPRHHLAGRKPVSADADRGEDVARAHDQWHHARLPPPHARVPAGVLVR